MNYGNDRGKHKISVPAAGQSVVTINLFRSFCVLCGNAFVVSSLSILSDHFTQLSVLSIVPVDTE